MWLGSGVALAGSLAATEVPSVGGGFAGPTEAGALGVIFQPAAAVRGAGPELAIDLGGIATRLQTQADNWDAPIVSSGVTTQPTLMFALPFGPVAIGGAFHGSYVRGSDSSPVGDQRFYTVLSTFSLIEGDLFVAARPIDALSFGGGVRIGQMEYESSKATELGVTLNNAFEVDPPFPIGEPLLEGTQQLGPIKQMTASWAAGVSLHLDPVQVDLSVRPGWPVKLAGPVQLVPSNDLSTSIDGRIDLVVKLPPHLLLASRIVVAPGWTVVPQVEWVGWRYASQNNAVISDLRLSSSDRALNAVLESSGLSEADFLASSEGPLNADLGWHDVINPALQVIWEPDPVIEVRAGMGYSPAAIPNRVLTSSNIDFGAVLLKLATRWNGNRYVRVGLTGERYQTFNRVVVDSGYEWTNGEGDLDPLPNFNGRYSLDMWRASLTLQVMLPLDDD